MTAGPVSPDRLRRAQQVTAAAGLDALLVSPGPDLRYLTGYDAIPLERLTCLVVPATGDPVLVVPYLERLAALASPVADLGIEVVGWHETDDPYALVAARLGRPGRVAVDDHMWAEKVLAFRDALPEAEQSLAGGVTRSLRLRKDAAEVEALAQAGDAIDRVHRRVSQWLRPGRTEREVAKDIADAILAEGHARVDFVIVGSGPNAASPHHAVSDRELAVGDPVVVDIGGTMPSGYCSDETRMYALGQPPPDFVDYYVALKQAQAAGVAHVRPGVTAESVDAAARDVLDEAGYGKAFIHRTGHGIGLETHEEPYIVQGSAVTLEPGMAFSVEPGVYLEGRHGARVEDIVVVTGDGVRSLNHRTRDLVVVE